MAPKLWEELIGPPDGSGSGHLLFSSCVSRVSKPWEEGLSANSKHSPDGFSLCSFFIPPPKTTQGNKPRKAPILACAGPALPSPSVTRTVGSVDLVES